MQNSQLLAPNRADRGKKCPRHKSARKHCPDHSCSYHTLSGTSDRENRSNVVWQRAIRPLSDIPIHSSNEQRSKQYPADRSHLSIYGFISATVSRIAVNDSAFTNHQNTSMSGRYSTRTLPLCSSEPEKSACPADTPPDRRSLSLRCALLKSHD